jgi:uncharacterized damage-inducible protein DinB
MRTTLRIGAAILSLAAATVTAAAAADAPAAAKADFRSDWLANFDYTMDHFSQLAHAIPVDKYGWRPAEGVRSVSEVVGHVAVANYFLTSFLGAPMPEGMTMDSEKEPDPAKLAAMLDASVEHVHQVVQGLSDADLEKPVEFFGQKMTERGLLLVALGHVHEHLGQLIAYARSNGVVPPWTAAAQKAAEEAAAKKPAEDHKD